ncbi:MAG: LptF/LptG family permease [Planctomycetota bacterium]
MNFRLLPRVDWYVTRSILALLVMCTLAICSLVAVIDAFQRVDEFVEFAESQNYGFLSTAWMVVEYYLCLTPQYLIQYMVPFISMLSGVSVVSMMASHREFTAVRASGVPLQRVLLPLLITTLALGLIVFIGRDSVLPGIAREAHGISLRMKPGKGRSVTVVLRDGERVHSLAIGHFDMLTRKAYHFRLEIRDWADWRAGRTDRCEVLTAEEATLAVDPDTGGQVWRLGPHAEHVRFEEGGVPALPDRREVPTLVTPAMLEQESLGLAVMTSADLARLSDDVAKQVELARRRAAPLAGTVVLLVGMSLIMRRERIDPGSRIGRVKGLIYAVFVCAAYYAVQEFCLSAAEDERIHPLLAAWIPNVGFGAWGGWSYWRVNL